MIEQEIDKDITRHMANLVYDALGDRNFLPWFREWLVGEMLMIRSIIGTREFDEDAPFWFKKLVVSFTQEANHVTGIWLHRDALVLDLEISRFIELDLLDNFVSTSAVLGLKWFNRLGWLGWKVDRSFVSHVKVGTDIKGEFQIYFQKTFPDIQKLMIEGETVY